MAKLFLQLRDGLAISKAGDEGGRTISGQSNERSLLSKSCIDSYGDSTNLELLLIGDNVSFYNNFICIITI